MSQGLWSPDGASPARTVAIWQGLERRGRAEPPDANAYGPQRQDPPYAVQYAVAEAAYGDLKNHATATQADGNDSPAPAYKTVYGASDALVPTTSLINVAVAESAVGRIGRPVNWPDLRRPAPDPQTPYDALYGLFRGAIDETFEDGMDSSFSMRLHRIILDYGMGAVDALEKVLDGANVGVAEEALRQIGYIDDPGTHRARLLLLEGALKSPNADIRDAASIGIEAMDDPAAIESLRAAIENEPDAQLRQYLHDVLAQLQDAR